MAGKRNPSHGRLQNYFCTCGSRHTSHSGLMDHIGHYDREPDGRVHEEVEDEYESDEDDVEESDDDWDEDDDWDDDEDGDGSDEPWNPHEESPEHEDMPGDNADDRSEAYDNM